MSDTRKTPLFDEHVKLGGHMAPFFGWEMPLWYGSAREEHLLVRNKVGLFDVSHMGQITVEGPEAEAAVDWLVAGNVRALADGQALYCPMLNSRGGIVDDLIVYRCSPTRYFICVNAATSDKDFKHMLEVNRFQKVEFKNLSPLYGQIAVQGPRSKELMTRYAPEVAARLEALFRFVEFNGPAGHTLISTTGYTGEWGYEIYCPPAETAGIWRRLLELGRDLEVGGAGLSSRDTLRLESKLCLYGQDIDDDTNPIEAGLTWTLDLEGSWFGKDALAGVDRKNPPRRLVGFEMLEGGMPRHGCEVFVDGRKVGFVTSGNRCPTVDKIVGLAYLDNPCYARGTVVEIDLRGKLRKAEVVKTPFYKRPV